MPFDMSDWLEDSAWQITGVYSEKFPKGDVVYSIPSPSIRSVALLRRLMRSFELTQGVVTVEMQPDLCEYLGVTDIEKVADVDEAMTAKLLGPAYQQMVNDGVDGERLGRVYQAAILKFTQSEEVVRRMIDYEGKAAALAAAVPNRAQKRAAKKAASKAPTKRASRSSSPTAMSKSSPARTSPAKAPASSATRARTASPASTRSSKTSAASQARQAPRAATA